MLKVRLFTLVKFFKQELFVVLIPLNVVKYQNRDKTGCWEGGGMEVAHLAPTGCGRGGYKLWLFL